MGALAGHIARFPVWAKMTLETQNFDIEPARRPARCSSRNSRPAPKILAFFDKGIPEARAAIAAASDEAMMQPWTLLNGGKPIFSMPRVAVLRSMIMNHMIHHRAQLGVYLRLNDFPCPPSTGLPPTKRGCSRKLRSQGRGHARSASRPSQPQSDAAEATHHEQLREEFNRWAEAGRGEGMEQDHLPIVLPVLDRMRLQPDDNVLDVGCGAGWLSRLLAEHVPEGRVVGIDVSDEMIRHARRRNADLENVMLVVGEAEQIPWDAALFHARDFRRVRLLLARSGARAARNLSRLARRRLGLDR